MSNRSIVRHLITLFALTISASALAAPITRIPLLPKSALAAMRVEVSQPARGYRDVAVRFGVKSEVEQRAVPAR
jgi:hypothetical protein